MNSFINDFILRGGEDFNSQPKTFGFTLPEANEVFNQWHPKLGKDDTETENYIECPVNKDNRLFIRAFPDEQPGNRSECYYAGFLIPKSLYQEIGGYYIVNQALCAIKLEDVQLALKKQEPILLKTERYLPRAENSLPYSELLNTYKKRFGEEDYKTNLTDFLLSVSVDSIDDWFQRLFIAINPYQNEPEYDIVIARHRPFPNLSGAQSQSQRRGSLKKDIKNACGFSCSSVRNENYNLSSNKRMDDFSAPFRGYFIAFLGLFVGLIGIAIGAFAIWQNNQHEKRISGIEGNSISAAPEVKKIKEDLDDLKKSHSTLKEKVESNHNYSKEELDKIQKRFDALDQQKNTSLNENDN